VAPHAARPGGFRRRNVGRQRRAAPHCPESGRIVPTALENHGPKAANGCEPPPEVAREAAREGAES
jgi:hypothetical protein